MAIHFWGPLHTITRGAAAHAPSRVPAGSSTSRRSAARSACRTWCRTAPASSRSTGSSEALRAELAKDGIYVTTVFPGLMRTGSPVNAWFKGQHREEFAWFAISDSMPLATIDARRAAAQIDRRVPLRRCRADDYRAGKAGGHGQHADARSFRGRDGHREPRCCPPPAAKRTTRRTAAGRASRNGRRRDADDADRQGRGRKQRDVPRSDRQADFELADSGSDVNSMPAGPAPRSLPLQLLVHRSVSAASARP